MSIKKLPPAPGAAVKSLSSVALLGLLSACGGGSGGTVQDSTPVIGASKVELSGSVGASPVTDATVSAIDAEGGTSADATSDASAEYSITLPSGTRFPVTLEATGGVSMVTGAPLEFALRSVAMAGADQTANINPFTTIIVEAARAMDGGLNEANLEKAAATVQANFSFGLDSALVADPIESPVTAENAATVARSSEALSETVRRVQNALMIAGDNRGADAIVDALAGDISDGVIDGEGPSADAVVAATANVLAAQVLVEVLQNRLQVQGAEATGLLDAAVRISKPEAMDGTAQVKITEGLLRQARVALAAAQVYLPDNALAELTAAVDGLSPGITSAQAEELLPADSSDSLRTLEMVATADAETIAAINELVYTGSEKPVEVPETDTSEPDTTAPVPDGGSDTTDGQSTVQKADYYVSPNGSDGNSGSESSPFATIKKAIAAADPGDLIYVRGGRYRLGGEIRISKSGTADRPIRLFAYPGERPILDASGYSGQDAAIWMAGGSHWHIKGLELANAPYHGLVVTDSSSHNVFEMLDIHGSGRTESSGSGVHVSGSASNNLFLNVDSHHNVDTTLGNADGFALKSGSAKNNTFRGCRAWNNSDDGWDFWNGAPTVIENSMAFRNGYDDSGRAMGDGNGFKLGQGSGGHRITNSMAWGNKQTGFDRNGSNGPNRLYNNTAWNNGYRDYVFRDQDGSILRNNISFSGNNNLDGSDHKYNSWNLSVRVTSDDFMSMDDSVITGPRTADGRFQTGGFLQLRAGSDLIDAGTNVGLPYNGSAPDLGAVETD